MDFPFGHHNHHRRDDVEEVFPPPGQRPPSSYGGPPPPQVTHVYHSSHEGPPPPMEPNFGRPPPPFSEDTYGRTHFPPPPMEDSYGHRPNYPPPPMEETYGRPNYPPPPMEENYGRPNYPPPPVEENYGGSYNRPPYSSSVQHVSHESESVPHHPHMPSFHRHEKHGNPPELMDKPSYRVYTKAGPNYSLTIRDGKVVLATSDPSDPFQHWFKDERFSTKVKDEEGFPSFALVNKATGLALKHSIGPTHPVQLVPYDPNVLDASVLWTESRDVSDGYRAIRMVNNTRLNLDAWNADKDHGGVRDGTIVALYEWWKGDNKNQQWKIVRH